MAYSVKLKAFNAEKARVFLKENKVFDSKRKPLNEKDFIFLPITEKLSVNLENNLKKISDFSYSSKNLIKLERKPRSIKEALVEELSEKELEELTTSFDSIGNIAVIEIPDSLLAKKELIGNALLKTNTSIKTVCRISSAHKGEFRIQNVEIIAGKKTTISKYKESNSVFEIDLVKTFFSPRLSFERKRISNLIKKDEVIGAFFAGVGPYPIVFAKNTQMKKAYAIELNPDAVEMMKKNIVLNKVQNKVEAILGDVKEEAKKFPNTFDRIVMPLPKDGQDFLDSAFYSIKSGGVIHFYAFVDKEDPFTEVLNTINFSAEKINAKIKIVRKAQVRSFSPKKIQIVIDLQVIK